ncbi:Ser-Thr-rich glycosyl-phosphatidyl-inositol-anchored membrane family-domain-containing protein [Aspergillus ambiguus]|uniref:GPI anchored serine-threonine rich protein n=1 Tax=Aspergillus ambiguus TaxID=176160 RepID=UPI003CCE2755
MRFFTTALVSALATLAAAASYTQPDYSKAPSGNPILKPGLNELVPVGQPYTITWTPTTEGPISLVLLRGPSSNVVPLETLAVAIPNSGEYTWTPGAHLEPDTTHYGLLLVVEGTGQYQWSTQFGIKNPNYNANPGSSSSSSSASSTSASASDAATTVVDQETTTICPETQSTTPAAPTTIPVVVPTSAPAVSTTLSSSVVAPTSTAAVTPSTSAPAVPTFTGAADRKAVSFGAVAVGVAAVLAF